MLSKTW